MKRFVISESEKTHIRNLYSIKEVEAEKVVSSLFNMAKDIAKKLEAGQQTSDTGGTTQSVDTPLGTEVAIGSKDKLSSPLKRTTFPVNNFGAQRVDRYGKRLDAPGQGHPGIDLTASSGTELFAPGDGKVSAAVMGNDSCGGKIRINHTNGLTSSFCHLSGIFVKNGDSVKRGDKIGLTGGEPNTAGAGKTTEPHLHWEIRSGETLLDPIKYAEQKFYNKDDGKYYSV